MKFYGHWAFTFLCSPFKRVSFLMRLIKTKKKQLHHELNVKEISLERTSSLRSLRRMDEMMYTLIEFYKIDACATQHTISQFNFIKFKHSNPIYVHKKIKMTNHHVKTYLLLKLLMSIICGGHGQFSKNTIVDNFWNLISIISLSFELNSQMANFVR